MAAAGALVSSASCLPRGRYRGAVVAGAIEVPREALGPVEEGGVVVVRAAGAPGPIGLRRSGGELRAFLLACPHAGCEVDPSPTGFDCPCHGSSFSAGGEVLSGPASRPLRRLPLAQAEGGARIEVGP